VYRIDVTGALMTDNRPRYGLPDDLVDQIEKSQCSPILMKFTLTWNTKYPNLMDISDALLSLANLASHTNHRSKNPHLWNDEFFLALTVYPILHQILSLSRYPHKAEPSVENDGVAMREIVRITSIIFLGLMKKRFGVDPYGIRPNSGKISKLLQFHPLDWSQFLDVRLWILVISALAEVGEERRWFVSEVTYTMINLGVQTWNQALHILKSIVWIDGMIEYEINKLGEEIEKLRIKF
jgi:hypothetical protein